MLANQIARLLRRTKDPGQDFRDAIVEAAHREWLSPQELAVYRSDKGWSTDQPDWCGEFAGYCAGRAGLAQAIRRFVTPSTYRLASPDERDDKWKQAGYPRPADVPRGDVRPGDIVTVVTGAKKPYGDHIVIVYAVLDASIYTYEGNARGLLPTGELSAGRWVVRQHRLIRDIRGVYRFGVEHKER